VIAVAVVILFISTIVVIAAEAGRRVSDRHLEAETTVQEDEVPLP
jgi:hypothetical protein